MDKATFSSTSSFMLVTKSDSLSGTTSAIALPVPSQQNGSITQSASSAETASQSLSWQSHDKSRFVGTHIKLVVADPNVSKHLSSETSLQIVQSNSGKSFCATPLTNSVTILPGSTILPKNSINASGLGGRVMASVALQSTSKGRVGAQTVAVIPMNFAKSTQELTSGNNIVTSLVSKGAEVSKWNPSDSSSSVVSGLSSLVATKSATFSPNKLFVLNSNQMHLLQSQPQSHSRSVVLSQRRLSAGQQLAPGATFATVPGSGSQFVQLLTTPQFQVKDAVKAMMLPAVAQINNSRNRSSTIGQPMPVVSKSNGSVQASTTQRLILPATSHVQFNMAMTSTNLFQSVPSSAAPTVAYIASAVNPQTYAFVQSHPVTQVVSVASVNHHSNSSEFQGTSAIPVSISSNEASTRNSTARQLQWSSSETTTGPRPRKPCNCTKSQCLKLYCECFANSEFCHECNCCNCFNNIQHEDERVRAIKSCLERNPNAFHPKIGKGGSLRQHNKGCNCKRSGCLKNYCECYEAKILCSNLCRCVGCRNFEESADGQTLLQLANAAEVRVQQQTAAETKLSNQILGPTIRPISVSCFGERLPYTFMTLDVIEAVSACLLTEVEAKEKMMMIHDSAQQECQILLEFGRCLTQIIQTASRTRRVEDG